MEWMDSTTSTRRNLQAAQAKLQLWRPAGVLRVSCENRAGMQQDSGVDLELSPPLDLAEDQAFPPAETRFAGCKCPSVDQSKWDRLGPRLRNIREASHAGGWPRCARWDRGWDRTSGDDRRPPKRRCSPSAARRDRLEFH